MLKRLSWRLKLILIVGGVLLIFNGFSELKNSKVVPEPFDMLKEDTMVKGQIVEGDIRASFGAYAQEYKTNYGIKTSGGERYFYMIPVGDSGFMGIVVSKGAAADALEKITTDTFNALETGEMAENYQPYHFTGHICAMTNEDKGYLHDYMLEGGFTEAEINQSLVPYYISPQNFSNWKDSIVVGGILLFVGVLWISLPLILAKKNASSNAIMPEAAGNQYVEVSSNTDSSESIQDFPSFPDQENEQP